MAKKIDLTGQRFGKLIVIEDSEERNQEMVVWKCLCDCGNETNVRGDRLKNGKTQSCGCYWREKLESVVKTMNKANEEKHWVEGTSLTTITSKKYNTNTSGVRGVSWDKKLKKWRAYIIFQRNKIHLGYFNALEEATKARKEAEEKYFHPILEKYDRLEEVT